MKVVILAAGFGARFGDRELPKPLTLLDNGQSILQLQIKKLSKHISVHDIIIVVGYHKEQIMEKFPDLLYVYSSGFARENTAKSLLRAINKIDDDVLWLNGDVVFQSSVLGAVLAKRKTCMLVNEGPVEDEEVKYRVNDKGKILEVSKEVKEAKGEALGINFCTRKDLPILRKKLTECDDRDYFEHAIEMAIEEGLDVWAVQAPQTHCVEIDFATDLKRANDLIHLWQED